MKHPRQRFGEFEFDPTTLELFRSGQPVHIQPQPAQVLRLLLERRGELVSREELRAAIWGSDRHVDVDRGLAYCFRHLRTALADDAAAPRFIETRRGVGYRFLEGPEVASGRTSRWRSGPLVAAMVTVGVVAALLAVYLTRTPTDPVLDHADAYLRTRKPEDVRAARVMYQRVIERSAEVPTRVLTGVAEAEAFLANYHRDWTLAESALAHARRASLADPAAPAVRAALALSLHAAGHVEEAAVEYTAALSRLPNRVDLIDQFALLHHQQGRLDAAVTVLQRRWRAHPPDSVPAGLLAVVLTELGFAAEAEEWNQLAEALAPQGDQARFFKGLQAARAGRYDEAEQILEPLMREPEPASLVVTLASSVAARRRGGSTVLPRLQAAVLAYPGDYHVRSLLSGVLAAQGRVDEARTEFLRVLDTCQRGATLAPASPVWARCLAAHLGASGDVEAGASWYERAVDRGWRKLTSDHGDRWLDVLSGHPRFQQAQARAREDVQRMRALVERAGVPRPGIGYR